MSAAIRLGLVSLIPLLVSGCAGWKSVSAQEPYREEPNQLAELVVGLGRMMTER